MPVRKNQTATSHKQAEDYIPTTRGVLRPWSANLHTQVATEGPKELEIQNKQCTFV